MQKYISYAFYTWRYKYHSKVSPSGIWRMDFHWNEYIVTIEEGKA
jgi:hypothetical protein